MLPLQLECILAPHLSAVKHYKGQTLIRNFTRGIHRCRGLHADAGGY